MNLRRIAPLVISCLLSFVLMSGWTYVAKAATYVEEFESKNLDSARWDMKAEGSASFSVEDGNLIMTSPADSDGILLYWVGSEIDQEDVTIEIKAAVAANTNNAAIIAFIRQPLPPTLNTTINAEWKNMIWCGTNTPGWYINNDDWKNTGVKGPEFEGIWKTEIKGAEIKCYFDDEEVVKMEKIPEDRYVCFGPDTYTSHYLGAMTIDWIKISGASVKPASVEASDKLSTVWGAVKNRL